MYVLLVTKPDGKRYEVKRFVDTVTAHRQAKRYSSVAKPGWKVEVEHRTLPVLHVVRLWNDNTLLHEMVYDTEVEAERQCIAFQSDVAVAQRDGADGWDMVWVERGTVSHGEYQQQQVEELADTMRIYAR